MATGYRYFYIFSFVSLICIISSGLAWAQQGSQQEIADRPAITALRLNPGETMTMDGRLDEAPWRRAKPATGFKQADPRNGESSTEYQYTHYLEGADAHCVRLSLS